MFTDMLLLKTRWGRGKVSKIATNFLQRKTGHRSLQVNLEDAAIKYDDNDGYYFDIRLSGYVPRKAIDEMIDKVWPNEPHIEDLGGV